MFLLVSIFSFEATAQHSVARQWNDALLDAIRNDFARPTIHARNLFHVSAAMYDAWAAYDRSAVPYLLGDTVDTFVCPFLCIPIPADKTAAREEAISYAAYRLLRHRFSNAPGVSVIFRNIDSIFLAMGYDTSFHSVNYASGSPAALGNYIAQSYIDFGLQDGSREQFSYDNAYYTPVNPTLIPELPGNPDIRDPNRWQPLTLDVFIDQSGNIIPINIPDFLSPEWGDVTPFSFTDADKTTRTRNGNTYNIWHDPGPPPMLDTANGGGLSNEYKLTFSLTAVWSAHLDPADSVMWDISPSGIGNIQNYPTNFSDYPNFYDRINGGDPSPGHSMNPVTGQPYAPQMVPRGDYTRVLAEFWADGPDSETPPGHWFTILNYVNDHPMSKRKWQGQGATIDELEWDVKCYFTLGGTMHDVAISSWSVKGWYDYIRPISAIRYMAGQGQSTDTSLSNYSKNGIPLVPGYIEVVDSTDSLAGSSYQHVDKIKLYAWQGPDSISNPATDVAGVDWILAENWWPYQRPTFITPPFAGYVSGHSTYSRAAAEVLTLITGDEYFPGGMGEFHAPKDEFLVFEDGPSKDVTLQWATYRDASDQCSLSRIWGGIHPPADDINGRFMGAIIGPQAFYFAADYFERNKLKPKVNSIFANKLVIADADTGANTFVITINFDEPMDTSITPTVNFPKDNPMAQSLTQVAADWSSKVEHELTYNVVDANERMDSINVRVSGGQNLAKYVQVECETPNLFTIDTENPEIVLITPNVTVVTDTHTGVGSFNLSILYNEEMDTSMKPAVIFPAEDPLAKTMSYNINSSYWANSLKFVATYDVVNASEVLPDIDLHVEICKDQAGNLQVPYDVTDKFSIDMQSTESYLQEGNVHIYPNPVGGDEFSVEFDQSVNQVTLQLYNIEGKSIFVQHFDQLSKVQVPVDNLAPGLYLLRIVSQGTDFSLKVDVY